jgi:hypothetical protein
MQTTSKICSSQGAAEKSNKQGSDEKAIAITAVMKARMKHQEVTRPEIFETIR